MKKDLLRLIDLRDEVQKDLSRYLNANDSDMFIAWKEELIYEFTKIYERTKKASEVGFEWEVLNFLKSHFDGYNDGEDFYKLKGKLSAIKNHIDEFYPEEKDNNFSFETNLVLSKENINSKENSNLKPKIFISHSNEDIKYTNPLVELLENIGLTKEHIVYTSIQEYGIPLNEEIYDYLKKQFQNYKLHVFFMLSDNYYNSPACLNEMGAAWILQNKYTTILLPNFEYTSIKGAVNPSQIGLKLDDSLTTVKDRLGELKDNLIKEFELPSISHSSWERKRDKFIDEINKLKISIATNHN